MEKICLFFMVVFISGCACHRGDAVYQYSAIGAFMRGVYDGGKRAGELKSAGDLGLGTFNGIDGEMIVLDGRVYQARSDGSVRIVPDGVLMPFAQVKYFRPDMVLEIGKPMSMEEFKAYLSEVLGTKNRFAALRIDGEFSYVKARSIGRQDEPYKPFQQVVPSQCVFEFRNSPGTLVGFYSPEFFPEVSAPGYHFHFLDSARGRGGHVLDVVVTKGTLRIDLASGLSLDLPGDDKFLGADFSAAQGTYK